MYRGRNQNIEILRGNILAHHRESRLLIDGINGRDGFSSSRIEHLIGLPYTPESLQESRGSCLLRRVKCNYVIQYIHIGDCVKCSIVDDR